ncbi:MAG TPA: hypothetical protein DCY20_10075 [Firmicutes bacterium]|nr:hypothetical protein [Bacillota bacterium]
MFVQKHKKVSRLVLISYLIFCGCFMFPLSNERWSFNFEKAYMIIVAYGILAILFASLLSGKKTIYVYLISLLLTTVGMVLRYIIEYGEYSNTINFTQTNIIIYLGIIPVFCTLIYWIICKFDFITWK